MKDTRFDVAGIGNAMVDVLVHADDDMLDRLGLIKGAMTLVDAAESQALYEAMPPGIEASGGSAANTMAGVASLGGRGAYIGLVSDDQLGDVFRHDIRASGIVFDVPPAPNAATGRCLIFITPDAQRTMQTFLGAGADLGPDDVQEAIIASASITYLEGYLWDRPSAKQAFLKAARVAHDAGQRVALTLSDPFCVERHRAEFLDLVDGHVDVLFANEAEVIALYEVATFEEAVERVRGRCEIAALTRSSEGSLIVTRDETIAVPAERIGEVVDTTGAGDMYAAGFMFGLTRGYSLTVSGRIASVAAAEVISHIGARPERPLAQLVRELVA